MNWFTKTFVSTQPAEKKAALIAEHGGCEHVEQDNTLLFVVSYENDSFGSEGYCMCEACYDAMIAEADEEEVVCYDCKKTVKVKDSIAWKWYDFYAPQGDEPLIICNECRTKEKHIERVRRDREDREEELDY